MSKEIKLGFESIFNGAVAGQQAKISDAGECYDPRPPCVGCFEPGQTTVK